ncbi:MAG TPA: HAMP domain-containing sensor histidine kinase [Xanthobacteraceae bacterium]|nr:HAMP domain-containing sensor histidine kinase [Xanthobacteraceae bacterium]
MNENAVAVPALERARKPYFGLSGKLLVLTLLFVMIAEVLIYVPSIANFRLNWLRDRLAAAHVAAMVLEAAPQDMVPQTLKQELLAEIGAKAVALKMGNTRRLLAIADPLPPVAHDFDMRDISSYRAIVDAFATLLCRQDDLMRVVGAAPMGGDFVEIVMDEAPLRAAMLRFSVNILLLSIIISAITATLVYLALHYLFVRPMRRIGAAMIAFRADPEGGNRITWTSTRRDEIGVAERGLAATQAEIASMLQQKNHLAALGLAVSKINHDLRNLLSSAQLFSDRLSSLTDPTVQRFAPKLMAALERAIAFCQSTLSYGQAQEPPPDRRMIALEALADDVRENLGLGPESRIRWVGAVERGLAVDADPDQLFRVLLNLARNAVQALESRAPNDPGRDQLRLTGRREGAVVVIEVSDTGPGVPAKARAHLFEAFQGSTRSGGSGLGLAIAAELVRAHGGDIRLVDGTIGATFRLTIPDRAVELGARRGERARA